MNKLYISPGQLLRDSFSLAWQVFESGYRPDFIVGIWRGGTPVGIAVHELLHLLGIPADHTALRTRSYAGMKRRDGAVQVDGLEYLAQRLRAGQRILLVDDVYDTGLSLQHVLLELDQACGSRADSTRISTVWFKPDNNRTARSPDYFVHRTGDWLVFPHELDGLTLAELRHNKPELELLLDRLQAALEWP